MSWERVRVALLLPGLGSLTLTTVTAQQLAALHRENEEVPHAEAVGATSIVFGATVAASGTTTPTNMVIHPIIVEAAFPSVYPPPVALPQPFPLERVDPRGFYTGHAYHESAHGWLPPAPPQPRVRARQFTSRG